MIRIIKIGHRAPLVVLGAGLGLIALAADHPKYDKYVSFSGWVYTLVFFVGVAVSAAAFLILCVVLTCLLILTARGTSWCFTRQVSRSQLKLVHDYLAKWFGSEIPPVRRMGDWHRRNNTIFQAIYRKRLSWGKTSMDLVGVFKVLPLTAEATLLLEQERVTGTTFLKEHIARKGETPASLYVGDVAGDTSQAKAEILRSLQRLVGDHIDAGIPIYTRPLTKHGARLVRKYDFSPINTDISCGAAGRIHKLSPRV